MISEERTHWNFNVKDSFSKGRDPIQGEFFNDEDIKDVSVALVRESFQNSLDSNVGKKIRIRIMVSGKINAIPPNVTAKYFSNYWDHLMGAYPDNKDEILNMAQKDCEFVVIEDFGTTGLTGDELAEDEPDDKKNNFFYFFRAEGKSGKSGQDKGRWGIGKYVFPKSSGAKAFFALTIRHEETDNKGPLLMGQAVIKGHKIGDVSYEPDGWYAIRGSRVYEPFKKAGPIDEFKSDWKISRCDESGLSVVVPYIEDVNEQDLFRSVIEEYMLVILRDQLEVELVGSDGVLHTLTAENLRTETERIFEGREEKSDVLRNLDAIIWGIGIPDTEIIFLNQVNSSPEWNSGKITEEQATIIRERLDNHERAVVRVPVKIRTNRSLNRLPHEDESYFDVIYVATQGNVKAQFFREGIKVSGVNGGTLSSLISITLIDSGTMATLLGDAEGPAHTDWAKERLGKKYLYSAKWIDFVRRAPTRIIETARGADREGDRTIAAGWFPDYESGRTPSTGPVTGKKPGTQNPPLPPLPPSKPKVKTSRLVDGFSVTLTEYGHGVTAIECKCAYDVRKGDPFRKWTTDDFDLKKIPIEVTGGSITNREGNLAVVAVEDPNTFIMHVRGFDTNRDISTSIRTAQ
jgi:hypothetical protein